mmetsp:Transcript_39615/g.60909  ORF Transcript_39615/g.60909 Transcript_39615/m.60909 type:complete len:627 (+) Transcript_39615:162-2042(+)
MILSMRLFLPLAAVVGSANAAAKLTHMVDGEKRNILFASRRLDEGYCTPDCTARTPSPVEDLLTESPVSPRPTRPPITPGPTPEPTPNPTPQPTPDPTPGPTPAPTPQPVNEECPFFTLDFANLVAGTYVHDELVYSHGVTITAKRKGTNKGYTPINGSHQNSGGAAMVFDTRYPTGTTGQGLCSGDDGDPDLGSPNAECPGGGPGHGLGGEPTRVRYGNREPNPYSNCDAQGNVLVIQESDKSCPDDTADGGWLIFEFEQATEVGFAKLLDVDEGTTPDFHFTHGGGAPSSSITNIPGTGDNGILKQPLNKSNVKQVSIEYWGSGSISELNYRFCPPQETSPGYSKQIINFDDGTLGGFIRTGSTSNRCAISNGSDCCGTKKVRCQGTNQDVTFQINAPANAYQMSYKFSMPDNMESADKVHVIVAGTVVKEYENDWEILDAGLDCFDGSVYVNPGDEIKFLVRTSTTSEYFDLHEVTFYTSTEIRYDFEDGSMSGWSVSGSGSNKWRVVSGSDCIGSKGVKAGPATGSNVNMYRTVPAGMTKMSYMYRIPNTFESSDRLWVYVNGVKVRQYEDIGDIRNNGTGGLCHVDVVNVQPGQQVKFTARSTSTTNNEYWEIDEIVFYQG